MNEKWRLPFWAAAAAKYMEFAATQRSASLFVKEGIAFFDKLKAPAAQPQELCQVFSASAPFAFYSSFSPPRIILKNLLISGT